jgi:hypothetical protein
MCFVFGFAESETPFLLLASEASAVSITHKICHFLGSIPLSSLFYKRGNFFNLNFALNTFARFSRKFLTAYLHQ